MATHTQEPSFMDREVALEDLNIRAKGGEMVVNHHRSDEPFLCQATSLLAGFRTSGQRFGYFVEGDQAHVITGWSNQLDIEGRFIDFCVKSNGKWFVGRLIIG